jgi:2-polyprenyl-6-methoxyphenol hydroxylase-like FAD-dependent oxidoreductase
MPMKVLIIGGGIGGLTTALVCKHFQLEYEVFEAAPEIREVGSGIWVPPNAMQVMHRLHLADKVKETGTVLDKISIGGPTGKSWYSLLTENIIPKFGFGTVAIHRARLQALLYSALDKHKVHTGKRLHRFSQTKEGVTLFFQDGSQASGTCAVGADGLRSVTRQQLFGDLPLRYSGQTCWRGIVRLRLPENMKASMIELWGKRSGQRFAYSQITAEEVYYYATLATEPGGKDDLGNLKSFLHTNYDSFGTTAKLIIDAIEPQTVIRTDLFDLKPIHTWTQENVALLGDAAHATTPNLGQGAAQAIEDAYVLISLLKKQSDDIPLALRQYQQLRIKKAHHIVNTSWTFGQLTNLKNPVAIALRNWFIRSTPDFIASKQIEKAYKINF